jgi:hypothetical protein
MAERDSVELRPLSMSVEKFAELVGVSRATAFKYVKDESVESFNIGRRRFIHYRAYVAFLDERVEASRRERAEQASA